jgi:hypothetical protein
MNFGAGVNFILTLFLGASSQAYNYKHNDLDEQLWAPTRKEQALKEAIKLQNEDAFLARLKDGRFTKLTSEMVCMTLDGAHNQFLKHLLEHVISVGQDIRHVTACEFKAQTISPLHIVVKWNKAELATLLIAAKSPQHLLDQNGRAPLHNVVVETQDIHMLSSLIAANADLDVLDAEGRTPLHLARIHGLGAQEELLAQMGAQVDLVDNWGKLASDYGERPSLYKSHQSAIVTDAILLAMSTAIGFVGYYLLKYSEPANPFPNVPNAPPLFAGATDCVICMQPVSFDITSIFRRNFASLACGHANSHAACLAAAFLVNRRCPECRAVPEVNFVP